MRRLAHGALLALALILGLLPARPGRAEPPDAAREGLLRAALAAHRAEAHGLFQHAGVVGSGVGLGASGEPVVRIFTERGAGRALPRFVGGFPVELRETGRIFALRGATCETDGDAVCETSERWPLPAPIGVSIGHPAITAGTTAARVSDGSQVYALSNNHVLANSNAATLGDAALQPGTFDGGSVAAGDAIGTLADFEPIVFCTVFILPICTVPNAFDAAIALTTPGELGFETPLGEFGSPVGYGAPNPALHGAYGDPTAIGDENLAGLLGVPVQKVGRTTGHTAGTIDTVQLSVQVCYDELCSLVALFDDQLVVNGAFSGGGDSGSLAVTDDGFRHPVGLLFAGGPTESILSRIDLVLDRFGVAIDDGGATAPFSDAAATAMAPPSFALVSETTSVPVTVKNVGTEPLAAFDVVFRDLTEATDTTLTAPALSPGEQAELDFAWTPTELGPHDLEAELQLVDADASNDVVNRSGVSVLAEPPGLSLELWSGTVRTDAWTSVTLSADYGPDLVVVCTPQYAAGVLGPLVARVRNTSGTGFEVGLGRPWFGAFPGEEGAAEVHCAAMRAGVYDGSGGPRLEAVRIDGFAPKDHSGAWNGQAQSYAQSYAQPVVVGQVISADTGLPGAIGVWSQFWARGATSFDPPSPAALFVGRHTGEDPGARPAETLAYVVIEAGTGQAPGVAWVAGLGPEVVQGFDDAPPYAVALPSFLSTATVGVASSAGMDGIEGGWPILYGAGAVGITSLGLAIDEDWYFDPERNHTTEQVGYVVFGTRVASSGGGGGCGIGPELALIVPGLLALSRRRRAA
ncbi:MAG: CARDB domain-containing protein [Myxococcota bacterium]